MKIFFCMNINNPIPHYLGLGISMNRRHNCKDISGKHFSSYSLAKGYRKCGIEI